ncbi:MAG TPA: LPS export ABC transporter periplasmic protein LptC [candidate division Zixibacteria bacterium]|nr:LPS export ABC transporter periplasmic protein LptC [candidate division Zixibacteria bacterium]
MRKFRRALLVLAIFVSLGGVTYKVFETMVANRVREIRKNPIKALDYLPESALRIKEFHRAKIEEGRKRWELFGEEASYSKEQKRAFVKRPRFYFYDSKGEVAEAMGEEGHLFLNETELERMQLQGSIRVSYQGYTLTSEEAVYLPAKDQIVLPGKVMLVGDGLELQGTLMEVELENRKVRLLRSVKTRIEPEKLARRSRTSGS